MQKKENAREKEIYKVKLRQEKVQKVTSYILALLLALPAIAVSANDLTANHGRLLMQEQSEAQRLPSPQRNRRRRVRGDRRRTRSIGNALGKAGRRYGRAGSSLGRGGARFGKNIAVGRPVRAGKELGKGAGGFGKNIGTGTGYVGVAAGRTGKRIGKGTARGAKGVGSAIKRAVTP